MTPPASGPGRSLALLACLALGACRPAADAEPPAAPAEEPGVIPPTRVRLDFVDRPAGPILAALGERSGMPVVLGDEDDRPARAPALAPAPALLTLVEAEPVPYWEALERVMRPSGLAIRTIRGFSGPNEPRLVPLRGVRGPVWVDGAFRCEVLDVEHARSLAFGLPPLPNVPGRSVPTRRGDAGPDVGPSLESLRVRVQIRPEPRPGLEVVSAGVPRVVEATDERGRSLVVDGRELRGLGALISTGGVGAWVAELPLAQPDPPATRLRRLVATAPFVVRLRRPDALDFALADAPGRSFAGSGAELTVARSVPEGEGGAATSLVELVFRPGPRAALDVAANLNGITFRTARGTAAFGSRTVQPERDGGRRLIYRFLPGQVPARLRFVGAEQVGVVVRFEFADLLLP